MLVVKVECDQIPSNVEVETRYICQDAKERRRLVELGVNKSVVTSLASCGITISGK